MIRRVLFIFLESPPLGFIKVNFDGSIKDAKNSTGYVIRDSEGRLLAIDGTTLFEPSILETELRVALTSIIYAIQKLHMEHIFIEGDSAAVISWIQDKTK